MKFLKNKITIITLALALFLPFFGNAFNDSQNFSSSLPENNPQIIKIVQSNFNTQFVKVVNAVAENNSGKFCISSQLGNSNLVQDTGEINLNQPANCFSLNIKTQYQAFNLSVQPLYTQVREVTVAKAGANFSPVHISEQNTKETAATLTVGFSLFFGLVFLEKKKFVKYKINQLQKFVYQPELSKLVMLRC